MTFFSFFLQTTILTLIGPLFTILSRAPEAKSAQGKGSPLSFFTFSRKHTKPDVPKGSPLWIFFRHCATFRKFFNVPKGSPFEFFWYFATECLLINPEGSPLLHFLALCDFFWKKKFFQKFQFFSKKSVLRFLSLRFGADFRRSRETFLILANFFWSCRTDMERPMVFSTLSDFFSIQFSFDQRVSLYFNVSGLKNRLARLKHLVQRYETFA